jgi:hypothetical protein
MSIIIWQILFLWFENLELVHSYIVTTNNQFGTTSTSTSTSSTSSEGVSHSLSSIQGDDDDHASAPKRPKLLASYWNKPSTGTNIPSTSLHQLNKYLAMEWTDSDEDCLSFWKQNSTVLDKLFLPALRALSVPASSSAIERVFSQGGIIFRPHRARMSDKLLSHLIFLKCNKI